MGRILVAIFLFSLLPLVAQPDQFDRSIELIHNSMVEVPGLARIGAPLLDGIRKTVSQMKAEGPKPGTMLTYAEQLRGYCSVLQALPKTSSSAEFEGLLKIRDSSEGYLRQLIAEQEAKLASTDRDQLGHYSELNRVVMAPVASKPRVIFLGDSITEDWRLNEYFQNKDYINRGIGGQVTGQLLGRMRNDVLLLKATAVLVQAGINDFGYGIPVETTQGNFQLIADIARANGIKVILASMLPIRRDYDVEVNKKVRAMNEWLSNLAKQRGYTFCDYYSVAIAADGRLKQEMSDEGKHPNATGYRQLAPVAQACINKALGAR